jgi:hypothetical protein
LGGGFLNLPSTPVGIDRRRLPGLSSVALGILNRLDQPPFVGRLVEVSRPRIVLGVKVGQPELGGFPICGIAAVSLLGDHDKAEGHSLAQRGRDAVAADPVFDAVGVGDREPAILVVATMIHQFQFDPVEDTAGRKAQRSPSW